MVAWWPVLLVCVVFVVLIAVLLKRKPAQTTTLDASTYADSDLRNLGGIPGPMKGPQGHHGPAIANAGGLVPFVKRAHEEYGSVVEFWLNEKTPIVSCNDPVLLKKTLKVGSRPKDLFRFLAGVLNEDNMQIWDAERAKPIRRLFAAPIGHQHLALKYDDVLDHAQSLVASWKEKGEGAVVALQEELLGFALRAVLSVLTGETSTGINFKEFQKAYDETLSATFDSQFGISAERKERLNLSIAFIKDCIYQIIENKRRSLKEAGITSLEEIPAPDLLETILLSSDPATHEPFANELIYSILAGYLLAAYHTSIVGVTWALLLLCQHPVAQQKVIEEVNQVFNGKIPEYQELDKMVYLGQVLKESMRIYTPGPFAARLIEEEMELGEFTLPKNSTLFYPLSAIHMSEKYWPQPTVFNPDRFAPENSKSIQSGSYVPFGMGPRQCPGDRVAWMEMRLLLALFFQQFSFTLDEPSIKNIKPVERFVLWAEHDIHVVLHPHSKQVN